MVFEVPVEAAPAHVQILRQCEDSDAADAAGSEKLHGGFEPVVLGQ
jgi:hypothetical protein